MILMHVQRQDKKFMMGTDYYLEFKNEEEAKEKATLLVARDYEVTLLKPYKKFTKPPVEVVEVSI